MEMSKNDPSAFLFSLDLGLTFSALNGGEGAIWPHSLTDGPTFGSNSLMISQAFNVENKGRASNSFEFDGFYREYVTGSKTVKTFTLTEIEVYKVNFAQ
jgi:hypothetical protein